VGDISNDARDVTPDLQDYVATTIPVCVDLDVKQVVLDLSKAEAILRRATSIALGPCDCRSKQHKCDAPIDTCLALNSASASAVETVSGFRYVDVETALSKLRASHEAGLVHLAFQKPNAEITEFCSCCSCCCWFFQELRGFDYHTAMIESSHVASYQMERCMGCGICVEKCAFGAWKVVKNEEKPYLEADRCFGCGVCVTACPARAIEFVPRVDAR
jgi:Na+-translocating ferredoxin:NAD+ oxidoreductase subunit B